MPAIAQDYARATQDADSTTVSTAKEPDNHGGSPSGGPVASGAFAKNNISSETLPQAVIATREAAIATYLALKDGGKIGEVSAEQEDLDGFSIGHMLHHLERKNLIAADIAPTDLLDAVFLAGRDEEDPLPLSRHRFIAEMKRLGLVDASIADKEFKPRGTTPCVRDVAALIEERCNVTHEEIASSSRARHIVNARFQAIWVLRQVCGHSLSMIGRQMGDRDHTTVLNSINKMMVAISSDIGMRKAMEKLCEKSDRMGVLRNRMMLATHQAR